MTDREILPEIVHLLDQEAAEFNTHKDEFESTFGFPHTCTCDSDYTEGRVGETTLCFTTLAEDALAACERLTTENKKLRLMVDILSAEDTDADES